MYLSESDWVVKYYDCAFGISGENEAAWYLAKAAQYCAPDGPVLDLACGTGRLSILLAQQGFAVTALDRSSGMLHQFRRKLASQPVEIQQRIQIEQQSMAAFHLDRQFGVIVCCDAFFHNLTVDDQIACLDRVAGHLSPEGRFVFNLPNPTCEFILSAQRSGGAHFTERGRYPLADGAGSLLVEHAQEADTVTQTITTRLRFTHFRAAGKVMETGESSWTSRYTYRYEMEHLLARCGLAVESVVGDYTNNPVTEGGQLIFQVRKL